MESLVVGVFLVFSIGRGHGAVQHLRGVVVFQAQLIGAGGRLALVDELAKIALGRVHFILASLLVLRRRCFVPFDLFTRSVGGLFVILCGSRIILQRERG